MISKLEVNTGSLEGSQGLGVDVVPRGGAVVDGSLAARLVRGELGAALSFAGQGANCFPELAGLVREHRVLRGWLELAQNVGTSLLRRDAFAWSGLYERGFEPMRWVDDPSSCPSVGYLTSSAVSQPLIFITQVMRYQALWSEGLGELMESGAIRALTGHSQGMMPALLVASSPKGVIDPERFARFVEYFLWQGLCMTRSFAALGPVTAGVGDATPMAAVSGLSTESLEGEIERLNRGLESSLQVSIALYNTRLRHVVSGPAVSLMALRESLEGRAARQKERKKRGRFAGRVETLTWEFIDVGAAFHSAFMSHGREEMLRCVQEMGFCLNASDLWLPVHSPADGALFNGCEDLTTELVTAQFVRSVRWTAVADEMAKRGDVDVVLDLGPGESAARLLASGLRGSGLSVVSLVTDTGARALWTPGASLVREPLSYARFAPKLVRLADGRVVVDNPYTRWSGHAPVILPGMTPTTSDAEIVAAAANKGFTAELAGGGQVTEAILQERIAELCERLQPGAEVVWNALYLDPYLWGMHLGKQRLVQKARKAGAPICGVTISAGIPETDEAVRLLDELVELGVWLNAFKPGTFQQIQQVVRIARAASHHTIVVHLEGGRAGGHHSWEDLDQLLLDGYHTLRSEPNVILCVGGGIGTPERAADLLTGRWADAYGQRRMPVDGVLLGTVTMACAEAYTSPNVKRALVDAAGTERWVFSGDVDGDVTSGRSQLNADIHYLDNAAARCGRILDEVAGDAEAVESRREEIIAALNQTAKPFFGDVESMTYLAVLERIVELMAIGSSGRYEDGVWLDRSWRERCGELLRVFEARLSDQDEGECESVLQDLSALDEPRDVLERFARTYPSAATRTVHPLDRDHFIAVCRRPGKPVNFVPVLDADVRRWFKADSLWQAHHPNYSADQVLTIPGPAALRGIVRADEPIAELLQRFEDAVVARLVEDGVEPVDAPRRDMVPGGGIPQGLEIEQRTSRVVLRAHGDVESQAWFGYMTRAFSGRLPQLIAARRLYNEQGRSSANPIRTLCLPLSGASMHFELGEEGAPLSMRWKDGSGDEVVARCVGDSVVELQLCVQALEGQTSAVYRRVLAWTGEAFVEQTTERSRALRTFYHTALFGESLDAVDLFAQAHNRVEIEGRMTEAYATLTRAPAREGAPTNMAFSWIWKPLMRALSCDELAGGLLDLVHLSNRVDRGPAWPPSAGEILDARARVTRVENHARGREVFTEATLERDGTLCARVTSAFFIHGDFSAQPWTVRAMEVLDTSLQCSDSAAVAYLQSRPWFVASPHAELHAGDVLTLRVELVEYQFANAEGRFEARGVITRSNDVVARIAWDASGSWRAHPVRAAADQLALRSDQTTPVARKTLAVEEGATPVSMESFARVGRDFNPIHRSTLMARVANLSEPIVHGMWTAARMHGFLVREVAQGRSDRLDAFDVSFLATAQCGERLVLSAARVGVLRGDLRVEVTAEVVRGDQSVRIAQATATLRAPRTAYVLPGQGIQRQGMGMDGYARSAAARRVWDRADLFTRTSLGFSIVRIVRDNPTEMIVNGERHAHPRGVLNLTQFTQVAMAVLSMAQVAELREAGVFVEGSVTCGHSVGEYNALSSIAQVLPLENVVEIVYQRGCVMHHLVPRDASGESGYRMGVIRPNCANLNHAQAEELVAEIREETQRALEIVNYNVRGWQYSVTGHSDALRVLEQRLEALRPAGAKAPYIEVPGIDVPFHSRVLSGGVASFRNTLRERLPERVEYEHLLGRYIPNLVPKPFSLGEDFVREVFETTQSDPLREVLDDFATWQHNPAKLARTLLIELLAWQFASPVRWIETQEHMMRPVHQGGLGIERIIEVGVGYQPTLVGMARATLRVLKSGHTSPDLFNVEAHAEDVFYTDTDPVVPVEAPQDAPSTETPAAPVFVQAPAPVVSAAPSAPVEDRPVRVLDALKTVLALQARVRPEQIREDETIDDLFEGVSSRRNQALIDLGAEFGTGAVDGAHEMPISALAQELARRAGAYQAPGPYLSVAWNEALGRAFGRARVRRRDFDTHLTDVWGFGPGLLNHALNAVALETRSGDSGRGGNAGSLSEATTASEGTALLDAIAAHVGASLGLAVSKRTAGGAGGGAVDAAAVQALDDKITGPGGLLAQQARATLSLLGEKAEDDRETQRELEEVRGRLASWERAHGAAYHDLVQPRFEPRRHVAMSSAWAWGQRDIGKLALSLLRGELSTPDAEREADRLAVYRSQPRSADTARWYADLARKRGNETAARILERILADGPRRPVSMGTSRPSLTWSDTGSFTFQEVESTPATFLRALWDREEPAAFVHGWDGLRPILERAHTEAMNFQGRTALVTGASPGSIALETVRHLLRGGARVIVTTTRATPKRLRAYRTLYQRCAVPGAELHVVPFNQASFEDIEALVDWMFSQVSEQSGATRKVLKAPFAPDIVLPFGAMGDVATLDAPGERSLAVIRAMLLGVERLVGAIGRRYRREGLPGDPCHVVLPLSPNHGSFGGDGAYAETKAALEVMLNKWTSEQQGWGQAVTLCGARIGWVRGTGLMDANNPVAALLEERTGALTYSSGEMGWLIAALCTDDVRNQARRSPLRADLTGGFATIPNVREVVEGIRSDLADRAAHTASLHALQEREDTALGVHNTTTVKVPAVADPFVDAQTTSAPASWPKHGVDLSQAIVIVGAGELGPWGHARTRFEVEVNDTLSAAGTLELAWVTGLVEYRAGQWFDTETGSEVPEHEIAERYRAELRTRSGIRIMDPEMSAYDPQAIPMWTTVFLERDFTFAVSSQDEAALFAEAAPEHTSVHFDSVEETWNVTRRAGSSLKVPRTMKLSRRVAGLIPTGFDFARYGVSPDMIANVDRLTLFNLIATVDAFISSGLSPEELMRYVHPALVANTQGSGIGGMRSLQRLYVDYVLGQERQSDVLQETLINVVAAYVVQSYVGSYGAMSHPVAACATAAVSLEEGMDKILRGRAEFVVAGGFDDIGPEGALGFSDMGATADTEVAAEMGLDPNQISRPNDARRRGFVEAQGGGTILLARGDVALRMGLPVLGVLGWAGSFGDGIHKSIPAPGLGALAAAMGGSQSPLGRTLSTWGLSADDIALVYKHDTSTNANDPNENALHHRIQEALGRTPGNPLWVVSQKSLTGHPKGGAAAWQTIGLCQCFAQGVIPGNRNLESVDPAMQPWSHVAFTDSPIHTGPDALRAGLITSLGFGHVGAIALLLHPDAFLAQLSDEERSAYLERTQERRRDARRMWSQIWMGQRPAFSKRTERRFNAPDGSVCQEREEVALLLDPRARLDPETGRYVLPTGEGSASCTE